jgi:hypothetical protein
MPAERSVGASAWSDEVERSQEPSTIRKKLIEIE